MIDSYKVWSAKMRKKAFCSTGVDYRDMIVVLYQKMDSFVSWCQEIKKALLLHTKTVIRMNT